MAAGDLLTMVGTKPLRLNGYVARGGGCIALNPFGSRQDGPGIRTGRENDAV